jgi:small-conductance mechanosensitive channel
MDIRQTINLRILEEFEKRKIQFAYPTQSIFISQTGKENPKEQMVSEHNQ